MTSPGQSDRVKEVMRKLRASNVGLGLVEAIRMAEQLVQAEDEVAKAAAHRAVRVNRSARTLTDTQVDLLCRGEMSMLAVQLRVQEIEDQHRGKKS